MGAEKALTGPARRGDRETINKHLNLLKDYNEEKEIYKLLTNYIINKYLEKVSILERIFQVFQEIIEKILNLFRKV